MTTFINKADGSVVKQIPMDKQRLFSLQETLGKCFMKIDDQELRREINRQSQLLSHLGNMPKGTLLELI